MNQTKSHTGIALPDSGIDVGLLDGLDQTVSSESFSRCGYLRLPRFLTDAGLVLLRAEVARLLERAKRRDFSMESMGGSPRHMTTLGGLEIVELAPRIAALYHDPKLVSRLSELVGLKLEVADDPVERHVLNHLHRAGDTHGLHTDDYPLAMVIFLQSPSCEAGCGHVEFFDACEAGKSSLVSHQAGDAYLLRADRLPHRVRPIHDGCVRTVLNFAYGAESVPVVRSGTASILYS